MAIVSLAKDEIVQEIKRIHIECKSCGHKRLVHDGKHLTGMCRYEFNTNSPARNYCFCEGFKTEILMKAI